MRLRSCLTTGYCTASLIAEYLYQAKDSGRNMSIVGELY